MTDDCEHEWVACGEAFMTWDPLHPVVCDKCGNTSRISRSRLPNPPDHERWMRIMKERVLL